MQVPKSVLNQALLLINSSHCVNLPVHEHQEF